MANVFHVEFGINDTPLTRALEEGNYTTAERLIVECSNPSYLDEGCYQRTPVFICLCGVDEEEERVTTRNFFLARLIVEHGANVNYRVPQTLFGSEYIGPGKTCLELLVDFYNDLTHDSEHYNIKTWQMYHRGWDPAVDIVVGLDRQYLSTVTDIIDHMEELILIILSNGGDPNILDENRMTLMHRIAMVSRDPRLVRLLCDFGANVNAVDNYGNTPLLALCDVSISDVYDFMEDLSPSSDDTLEDSRASLCVRNELLDYFLSKRELELDTQNNLGQTALFHCVLRGDMDSVHKLLKFGANPTLRGCVWETRKRKRKLSPLFASFLSIPIQRSLNWQNMHHKLTAAPQQLAHLVDAGFFTRKEIVEELQEYLTHEFPEFSHLHAYSGVVLHLMFGRTTSTLSQLAASSVFQMCLIQNTTCLQKILPVNTFKQQFLPEDLHHFDTYEEYVTLVLNRTVLTSLVQMLGLPQDSLLNFEVELLLHQMAVRFSKYKIQRPEHLYSQSSDASEDSVSSDNSDVSQEDESDLEYW